MLTANRIRAQRLTEQKADESSGAAKAPVVETPKPSNPDSLFDPNDPPEVIEDKAAGAEEHLAGLERTADTLEGEAEKARTAFADEPTPETMAAREIAVQKAANARKAANDFRDAVGALVTARRKIQQQRRLGELRQRLEWRTGLSDSRGRLTELVKVASERLSEEITTIVTFIMDQIQLAKEARDLEKTLGLAPQASAPTLSQALEHIEAALTTEFGKQSPYGASPSVKLAFVPMNLDNGEVRLRINHALRRLPTRVVNR